MNYGFFISDDDLTRLADESDIEPEFLDAFKKAMSDAATAYVLAKNAPFATKSDVKNRTKKLSEKASKLVQALDQFEDALEAFPRELKHPAARLKDKCASSSLYGHLRSPAEVQTCREIIKADTEVWEYCASRAYDAIGKLKPGGGENKHNKLIDNLIIVYAAGGKKISMPTIQCSNGGQYGGNTYEFIERCFDLLKAKKKVNGSMAKSIERACDRWRRNKKPEMK
jgi:hypothetical protein